MKADIQIEANRCEIAQIKHTVKQVKKLDLSESTLNDIDNSANSRIEELKEANEVLSR